MMDVSKSPSQTNTAQFSAPTRLRGARGGGRVLAQEGEGTVSALSWSGSGWKEARALVPQELREAVMSQSPCEPSLWKGDNFFPRRNGKRMVSADGEGWRGITTSSSLIPFPPRARRGENIHSASSPGSWTTRGARSRTGHEPPVWLTSILDKPGTSLPSFL